MRLLEHQMVRLLVRVLTGFLFITVEGTVPSNRVVHHIIGTEPGTWTIVSRTDTLYAGPLRYASEIPLPTRVPLNLRRVGP